MSYLNLLSRVEIFEGLTDAQLNKVESICTEKNFDGGQIIFEENTPSNEFYIITKGKVEIQLDPDLILKQTDGDDHAPQTITTLSAGQSFGEIALVDRGNRSATAKAGKNPVNLLTISRDDFMNLSQTDIELGFIIMKNLAADLCFKIRNTNLIVREALLF